MQNYDNMTVEQAREELARLKKHLAAKVAELAEVNAEIARREGGAK